jgi:UDP-glucose 4-epimerase
MDDLVGAMLLAIPCCIRQETHQVLNLGPGREWSVQEAVDILCEISGRKIRVVQDESRVRPVDRMHLRADITRARQVLGWEPRHDLRTGLQKTYASERAKYPRRMVTAPV